MIAHTLSDVAHSYFRVTIILIKIIFIKFLLTALFVIILMKIVFIRFLLTALLVIIARHGGFAVASLAVTPTVF